MVLPMEGDRFHTPNGMSWRPNSANMLDILRNFKGSPTVYCLPVCMTLPPGLVAIHEHSDHWSLQTQVPVPLAQLNQSLTELLTGLVSTSKENFLAAQEDEDDQDN